IRRAIGMMRKAVVAATGQPMRYAFIQRPKKPVTKPRFAYVATSVTMKTMTLDISTDRINLALIRNPQMSRPHFLTIAKALIQRGLRQAKLFEEPLTTSTALSRAWRVGFTGFWLARSLSSVSGHWRPAAGA